MRLRGEVRGLALSPREVQSLAALARHGRRKDAAAALGLRDQTLGNYLSTAYAKLGAGSATEAFRAVGWLRAPSPHGRGRRPNEGEA